MNKTKALEMIEQQLPKGRYEHSLRVAETAIDLAARYHAPKEKVELAALLHDYAKNHAIDELKHWIENSDLPKDLLDYHSELWHGPVGALILERDYGITDTDILSAIDCHTTGKVHMSKIDKIIFVADYIEPGRDFPGLNEVRDAAVSNLDQAAWLVSRNTIQYLMDKRSTIYPDSFYAYNDLTQKLNGGIH